MSNAPRRSLSDFESHAERQIREAIERGEFDDLPGAGKPLKNLSRAYDENWWARELMQREGVSWLPRNLEIRGVIEKRLERLTRIRDEALVRREIQAMNETIAELNRTSQSGPSTSLGALDPEAVVEAWRQRRE